MFPLHQPLIADHNGGSIHRRDRALSGDRIEAVRAEDSSPPSVGVLNECARQRVFGFPFGRGEEGQHILLTRMSRTRNQVTFGCPTVSVPVCP